MHKLEEMTVDLPELPKNQQNEVHTFVYNSLSFDFIVCLSFFSGGNCRNRFN